jgi:hypothetical protein
MRTAIFVYQTTSINILTNESDLQLDRMNAGTVPLSAGENEQAIAPGIYKIVSTHDVQISGDAAAFDFVTTSNKDNVPTPPPKPAAEILQPLDMAALEAFFAVPAAKELANP